MTRHRTTWLPSLAETLDRVLDQTIPADRRKVIKPLIDYIQSKVSAGQDVHLNFICTHNSRRSQFAQIWAQAAAAYYGVAVQCCSGGIEVTAFNERAVASIKRSGFLVLMDGGTNPVCRVFYSQDKQPVEAFSKLYDNPVNRSGAFAAVMTCSHAEENCPFIPGVEKRISLHYRDPKEFDDTPMEAEKYDACSMQVAAEMFYVFSKINIGK
jgi:arsenate reductase